MSERNIIVVARKGCVLSSEKMHEIEKQLRYEYGSDCTIQIISEDEFEVGNCEPFSPSSLNGNLPTVNVIHNYYDLAGRYTPLDIPSKKAQRISPYAKFDKFHHKKKRK